MSYRKSPSAISSFQKMDDGEILQHIINKDDAEAVQYLLNNRYRPMLNNLSRFFTSSYTVDDLINDMYLKLREQESPHWRKFHAVKSSLRGWLRQSAVSVCYSNWDKSKENLKVALEDFNESEMMTNEPNNQQLDIILEALNNIPNPDHRYVLIQRLKYGYNSKEIAQLLEKKRLSEGKPIRTKTGHLTAAYIDNLYRDAKEALIAAFDK